ncbi:MAG TPA: oligosaccharide flippase family protein [Gemmataceae bacterium]|nr:oligosaccharide flippase family protein [Gemmataceae bacterium]
MPRVLAAGRRFVRGLSSDARAGLFGLGWSYLTHGLQIVIRFASSLILTRLLMPEAYGIFGPALAVMFFLEFLSDIGLRPAVVRSPHGEDPAFLGTAWSVVMVRAGLLSVLALTLAWLLPPFYDLPLLGWVLLALAGRPIVIALQNPTLYVLFRRLDYRTPFFLDILQSLFAVPLTILLAWQLGNVWALVLGLLFGDVARLLLSHILCPPAPRLSWHKPAVRELSHFGISIFLNTLFYGAWIYFDRLAGPKFLSPDLIGLYITAWGLAEGLDNLIGRGSEVFYAMLSRKPEEERQAFFRRMATRVALYLIPGVAVAALAAPWAFRLLYPIKFHGAAVLLGLLTARLIMRGTSHLQFMYLMMRGEVYLATRAYVVSLVILVAAFVPLVREFGVLGIALSSVLAMTTFALAQTVQMVRRGETSPWPAFLGLAWTGAAVAAVLATN